MIFECFSQQLKLFSLRNPVERPLNSSTTVEKYSSIMLLYLPMHFFSEYHVIGHLTKVSFNIYFLFFTILFYLYKLQWTCLSLGCHIHNNLLGENSLQITAKPES